MKIVTENHKSLLEFPTSSCGKMMGISVWKRDELAALALAASSPTSRATGGCPSKATSTAAPGSVPLSLRPGSRWEGPPRCYSHSYSLLEAEAYGKMCVRAPVFGSVFAQVVAIGQCVETRAFSTAPGPDSEATQREIVQAGTIILDSIKNI